MATLSNLRIITVACVPAALTAISIHSSTLAMTLRTLDGEITLDAFLEEEQDMLRRLIYPNKRIDFLAYLLDHSAEIEAVVSYHLGLKGNKSCCLTSLDDWIHGSFNMCIPVYVQKWKNLLEKRVMIRFPLLYKIDGEEFSGNAEEKLRYKVATYIWV